MSDTPQTTPAGGTNLPPKEHQFKPGQSGNPAGRPKNAGQTLREWINTFVADELDEDALRRIARGKSEPVVKRAAAERLLRTIEAPDMADFEDVLSGRETLREARGKGLNTEAIKKAKRRVLKTEYVGGEKDGETIEQEVEIEVELYDRAGTDFDRVIDRTDGRPTQSVKIDAAIDHNNTPTVAAALLDPEVVIAAIELEERMRHARGPGEPSDAE